MSNGTNIYLTPRVEDNHYITKKRLSNIFDGYSSTDNNLIKRSDIIYTSDDRGYRTFFIVNTQPATKGYRDVSSSKVYVHGDTTSIGNGSTTQYVKSNYIIPVREMNNVTITVNPNLGQTSGGNSLIIGSQFSMTYNYSSNNTTRGIIQCGDGFEPIYIKSISGSMSFPDPIPTPDNSYSYSYVLSYNSSTFSFSVNFDSACNINVNSTTSSSTSGTYGSNLSISDPTYSINNSSNYYCMPTIGNMSVSSTYDNEVIVGTNNGGNCELLMYLFLSRIYHYYDMTVPTMLSGWNGSQFYSNGHNGGWGVSTGSNNHFNFIYDGNYYPVKIDSLSFTFGIDPIHLELDQTGSLNSTMFAKLGAYDYITKVTILVGQNNGSTAGIGSISFTLNNNTRTFTYNSSNKYYYDGSNTSHQLYSRSSLTSSSSVIIQNVTIWNRNSTRSLAKWLAKTNCLDRLKNYITYS